MKSAELVPDAKLGHAKLAQEREMFNRDLDDGINAEEMALIADKATTEHIKELRDPSEHIRASGVRLRDALKDYEEVAKLVAPLVKELRDKRMALTGEVAALLPGLRDVRKFFLDDGYQTEVARLREFVDLCERLQRLKESGFLDDVADTILKLSDGRKIA